MGLRPGSVKSHWTARTAEYKSPPGIRAVVQVECRFFGPFRKSTGVERTTLETDAGTVGALLSELEEAYPELAGRLVGDGEPAGSTVVTKGKRDVRHLDGLETELEDGDVIRLVPSVYGG